jgi:hypothetical protein
LEFQGHFYFGLTVLFVKRYLKFKGGQFKVEKWTGVIECRPKTEKATWSSYISVYQMNKFGW